MKGVTKMLTVLRAFRAEVSGARSGAGRGIRLVLLLAAIAVCATQRSVVAQCGVGGIYQGQCVQFEWRPAQLEVFVGETVELDLYVKSVNAFDQPVQGIGAVLNWDSGSLELLGNKACIGGSGEGQVCVQDADCPGPDICDMPGGTACYTDLDCPPGIRCPISCAGVCTATSATTCDMPGGTACSSDLDCPPGVKCPICFSCPADQLAGTPSSYNWVQSGFPNDAQLDGLNADCGPGTFCSPHTGSPFNDGDAFFQAFKQVMCDLEIAPPPMATPDGLWVTRFRFLATAAGSAQVSLADDGAPCASMSKMCFGGDPATDGQPCNVESDCLGQRFCQTNGLPPCTTDADCTPGVSCQVYCKACEPQFCCTTDSACSVCSFAETRVVGGTGSAFVVTAPPSANNPALITVTDCYPPTVVAVGSRYVAILPEPRVEPVGLLITGVDPEVSCVSGHVDANGLLGGTAPAFQTSATWGTALARGEGLVSGKTYQVQTDCNQAQPGTSLSDPVLVTLWNYGDADNDLSVTILDITSAIDGFRNVLYLPAVSCATDADCATQGPNFICDTGVSLCLQVRPENVDIRGATVTCEPDTVVSILDIVAFVDVFRGTANACTGPCVP